MKIAAGADLNILSRALRNNPSALSFSPSASSKFPARNAADGTIAKIVQWNQVSGDSGDPENPDPALERKATIDTNLVKNPGAEQALAGWKKAPSTTASSTAAQANSGTKSFTVTGHASEDRYTYQDLLMRSGELAGFRLATRGNGTQSAAARVRNLDTGQWLQANGTWGDASADLGSQTAAAWATLTRIQFTVETFEETLKHQTFIRIELHAIGAGAVFFDDVELIAAVDGASVHGVGFPRNMAPEISSSDTGAFAGEETLRFSMEPFQPAFYSLLASPVLARYWQFVLLGVREATFKPWMGEFFLVQTVTLERSARFGSDMAHEWTQKKAGRASKRLRLPFRCFDQAWPQFREWFVLRRVAVAQDSKKKASKKTSEDGRIWIVAPEFEDKLVVYGRIEGSVPYKVDQIPTVADTGLEIVEDAYPPPLKGETI